MPVLITENAPFPNPLLLLVSPGPPLSVRGRRDFCMVWAEGLGVAEARLVVTTLYLHSMGSLPYLILLIVKIYKT